MSVLALRRTMRCSRRHTATLLSVLMLAALVAVHHSAIAGAGMHHGGMGTVIQLCLGVLTAVGGAVATAALMLRRLSTGATPRRLVLLAVGVIVQRLTLQPRASPLRQPLLCVWRR